MRLASEIMVYGFVGICLCFVLAFFYFLVRGDQR